MSDPLVHVVTFTLRKEEEIPGALRMLRRLLPRDGRSGHAVLLLCDLADAPGERMPGDYDLLARLQSGVMAIDARSASRVMLLARRRAWDDAARAYLGAHQAKSARSVIADLLLTGRTDTAFDAATISPSSLKDAYGAVLFSPLHLACTPDTPGRMLAALGASPCGCAAAEVIAAGAYPRSALSRLGQEGFTLSPAALHARLRMRRKGLAPADDPDTPAIFSAQALSIEPAAMPLAEDCRFVRMESTPLTALLRAHHAACLRAEGPGPFLPAVQLALLFAAALSGRAAFALAALLPEGFALRFPRCLPGALARLSLLPVTALTSLDALLMRLLARSPAIRLRVPGFFLRARGSAIAGGLLLLAALRGAQALAPLLPVSLLWLGAPLIHPALHAPTIERTPLTGEQQARLAAMAESAFFDARQDEAAPPARRMLAACAGCMLRLLEPDEAARQVRSLLDNADQIRTAADQAAVLASAQYLRENMAQCDAALRDLPQSLEALALTASPAPAPGALSALLRAACGGEEQPNTQPEDPLDALFLPLGPARDMPRHALTLPLTHPHTYLQLEQPDGKTAPQPVDRFLALAAAALAHPFYPVFMRSPVAGPYAALLFL